MTTVDRGRGRGPIEPGHGPRSHGPQDDRGRATVGHSGPQSPDAAADLLIAEIKKLRRPSRWALADFLDGKFDGLPSGPALQAFVALIRTVGADHTTAGGQP